MPISFVVFLIETVSGQKKTRREFQAEQDASARPANPVAEAVTDVTGAATTTPTTKKGSRSPMRRRRRWKGLGRDRIIQCAAKVSGESFTKKAA